MTEKIAIIGSGMAGLAAAWYLGSDHEVSLFEKQAGTGIAAHGVDAEGTHIDVPLRVIYPGYYPQLFELLQDAGVAVEPLDAALSFSEVNGDNYFRYQNVRWLGKSIPVVPPSMLLRSLPRQILLDLGRFMLQAPRDLRHGRLHGCTIGDYLENHGYTPAFVDKFLVPCFAGINTVSNDNVRHTPADLIARYFSRGFLFSSVFRAIGGARAISLALAKRVRHSHFDARIESVRRLDDGVMIRHMNGEESRFDRLIFATQANQVLALLADASEQERAVLAGIRYDTVTVLMHRDPALAPRQRESWAPVNYQLSDAHDRPMVTIWINALLPAYAKTGEPIFQTINPHSQPAEELVMRRTVLERPIVDLNTEPLLNQLDALHGEAGRRVFFAGSYAAAGIPLLESAAVSAKTIAQRIAQNC